MYLWSDLICAVGGSRTWSCGFLWLSWGGNGEACAKPKPGWVTSFQMLNQFRKSGKTSLFSSSIYYIMNIFIQGRIDDNIETVKKRLKMFSKHNLPVVDYYSGKGKVYKVLWYVFYLNLWCFWVWHYHLILFAWSYINNTGNTFLAYLVLLSSHLLTNSAVINYVLVFAPLACQCSIFCRSRWLTIQTSNSRIKNTWLW